MEENNLNHEAVISEDKDIPEIDEESKKDTNSCVIHEENNQEETKIEKEGKNHSSSQEDDLKENKDNRKEANSKKFYDHLQNVIKTQEEILSSTTTVKEKLKFTNDSSIEQLKQFKDNSMKYGKFLKMINEELHLISDLIRKIKQEVK